MRVKSVWKSWLALMFSVALLAACGGGGGGSPAPLPPPGGGEGTEANPITLTVGQSRSGSIGALGESFYKFTVTTAGAHTISITSAAQDLGWELYHDSVNSVFTNLINLCDNQPAGGNEVYCPP